MVNFANEVLEFIEALQGFRLASCVDTGSLALLVYDYLLTFEDERTLIWPSHWSIPKLLFLLTRYLPFVDLSITASRHFRKNMTLEACWLAYQSAGWLINIGIVTSECTLLYRTWAIWERTRFITVVLVIWAGICSAADAVIMVLYMRSIKFSALPAGVSGLSDCLVTRGNTLLSGVWITLMVHEAGIIILMVIKGIRWYRDGNTSALYLAVFRDGAIFYVYIFMLSVANVIVISKLSPDLYSMLASIERVTHAILTQRLLLTLRSTVSDRGASESIKLDTMKFSDGPKERSTIDTEAVTGTTVTSLTLN